jgi:phosphatidyl-myo-inositol dimannoside synthase
VNKRDGDKFRARVYRRPWAFRRELYVQAPAMGATVAEIMLRERPNIVQIATAYDGYLGLHLNRWLNLPFVIYAHGNEILDIANATYEKPKLSLQHAARVLANSRFTAELVTTLGVAREKVMVLHPGCNVDWFRPRKPNMSFRQELLREHSHDRVILTVGNLVARKGHDTVLAALPKIREEIPQVVYCVVGDGPYRRELDSLARRAGVLDRVIFAGHRPENELPDIYGLADIFVMASRATISSSDVEGFGMVFLEASACEKPVIAGRSGGIPDVVVDGVTGFLVDPNDPEEVARSIIRVLKSEELASELGKNGRQRVVKEFTWDCFARRLRELLSFVLREHFR